jgi:hypothetical protein
MAYGEFVVQRHLSFTVNRGNIFMMGRSHQLLIPTTIKEDTMNTNTTFFSKQRFLILLTLAALGLVFIACGSTSEQKSAAPAKETGSLSRTFKIIDENGRESGTLTLEYSGEVILRDENNNVVGKFKKDSAAHSQPAETEPAATSEEAKSEDQGEESKTTE